MATTEKAKPGEERTIVASWVSRALADEIKRHAEAERRSVSSVIRNAVDKPRSDEERRR